MASLFNLVFAGPRLLVNALEAVVRLPGELEGVRREVAAGVREQVERLPEGPRLGIGAALLERRPGSRQES